MKSNRKKIKGIFSFTRSQGPIINGLRVNERNSFIHAHSLIHRRGAA